MMSLKLTNLRLPAKVDRMRRRLLAGAAAGAGFLAVGGGAARRAVAAEGSVEDLHFPGENPSHKVVYQFNHAEPDYHEHVLGSVGAMLRQYPDDIRIVVSCFAEGIHILAKHPKRPVAPLIQQRVSSLHQYGVQFHACGRTLESLGWGPDDLVAFAQIVPVGAADLMELQHQGYAYIAW